MVFRLEISMFNKDLLNILDSNKKINLVVF